MDIDELLYFKDKINSDSERILNEIITRRKDINSLTSDEKLIIIDEFDENSVHSVFGKYTIEENNKYKLIILYYLLIIQKINEFDNNKKDEDIQDLENDIMNDVIESNKACIEEINNYLASFGIN